MSQQINLYQAEFRQERAYFPAAGILRAILFWLLGLAVIYGHGAWQLRGTRGDMAQFERRVQQIEQWAEAQRPPRGDKTVDALTRQAEAVEARLRVLNEAIAAVEGGAIGAERGYARYFHAFAETRVADVWLTGFQFGPRGEFLGLSGRALDSEGPARFVQGLRGQPLFQGLPLSSVRIAKGEQGRHLDFSLQSQAGAVAAAAPTGARP